MGTVALPSLNIAWRRLSGRLLEVEVLLKVEVCVWGGYDNEAVLLPHKELQMWKK